MAKKKINTESGIIDAYMKYVLEEGHQPESVYRFAGSIGIKEAEFYDLFGSFESVESRSFLHFFTHTLAVLEKDENYPGFNAENKLLSFYFTLFEILKLNRSYVKYMLGDTDLRKSLNVLGEFRTHYLNFIKELGIETPDLKEKKLEELKHKGIKNGAWAQFLLVLKFWLDDNSAGFEKTDMLIEKSITTGFALIDQSTLSRVFDLGKFLFKEKIVTG